MGKVFFISDTHFDHENIIKYEDRPFKSIEEMNKQIIKNWNNTVKKNDKIFILGDFAFGNKERIREIISGLNGYKALVIGNHDMYPESFWREAGMFEVSKYPIIYKDFWILSHNPLYMNDSMPYCNIHGHIHSRKMEGNKYFNVSVECIDYKPILFEDIKKHIMKQEKQP